MYFNFTSPQFLFLILSVPAAILIHFVTLKNSRQKSLKFANFEAIARVKGIDLFSKNIVFLILTCVILGILTLAISGLTMTREAKASSFSFVLAIDSSRSMQADDFKPSRFESAKGVAKEFIDSIPTARMGIISFSGNSFIYQDLTEDKSSVKYSIDRMEISSIEGTDLYEAVITSSNMLKGEESRAIILLSDGQITVGSIQQAIDYANKNNVIIHTIAMGTKEGGNTEFGISVVDEDALKSLAYNTGGEFFIAEDRDSLIYSFNNALKVTKRKVSTNLAPYLLIIAIILLLAQYTLANTRYRAFP